MVSQYELNRQANIQRNRGLLMSLGLDGPLFEHHEKVVKKAPPKRQKRKIHEPEESYSGSESMSEEKEDKPRTKKVRQVEKPDAGPAKEGIRRSSRISGKNYKQIVKESPIPLSFASGVKKMANKGREDGLRIHDPKTYGHIPGITVGTWWQSRQGCSADAIHAPWVGGISGGKDGAHSVVLSGGYDDDVDLGYAFTYTGSGGRDLSGTKEAPKNLRTAPQSSDQTFDNIRNKMLQRSCETKKPVRVVRGFKGPSKYAPFEGYRYDGLYQVEKAWLEKGNNPKGFLVCKFAFKRLPGQPPIPEREDADEISEAAESKADTTTAGAQQD